VTTARAGSTAPSRLAALRTSDGFRRYTLAQVVSLAGAWMQSLALSWLVLDLTGSGTRLGVVVALQSLPVLLAGPGAGLVVDRHDPRRVLQATQAAHAAVAAALAAAVAAGAATMLLVQCAAVITGVLTALDHPARNAFVHDLVGPELLANALTVHSVVLNIGRIAGPAVGAATIAVVGFAPCFAANALGYGAVALALSTVRTRHRRAEPDPTVGGLRRLRLGMAAVAGHRELRAVLVVGALVGTCTYEFTVTLPMLASRTFAGGEAATAALMSAMGIGAVVGGIGLAHRQRHGLGVTVRQVAVLGAAVAGLAMAPTLLLALVAVAAVGAASVVFLSRAGTTVGLLADPAHRGQVLALWTVAFVGSTPIGGPVAGWVAEHLGPRVALGLGALACGAAALVGRRAAQSTGIRGSTTMR
jgi:MFS family permease